MLRADYLDTFKSFKKELHNLNRNFLAETKYVLTYIRDKKNNPIGVVLMFKDESNQVVFGWSKCHKPLDTYDRDEGLRTAILRAKPLDRVNFNKLPNSVKSWGERLIERGSKYFKVKETNV